MKSVAALLLIPLACDAAERASGIGSAMLPQNTGGAAAESITDEQLVAKRSAANDHAPLPKAIPPEPRSFGLLEMSTILQNGSEFLLLPKGSVLWCPPALKSRIVTQPSGTMTGWHEFLMVNRNWITHYEVSSSQVTGKTPMPPQALEHFTKGTSIVIATLNGGPVTVIQPAR